MTLNTHLPYLLPIFIFLARTIDVSLGTLRIVFIARNFKLLSMLFGFIEIMIWLMAISQIISNLTSWAHYIAYAGGFAMGNLVGMTIEEKIAMGKVVLRAIVTSHSDTLIAEIKKEGFGYTYIDAHGASGPVKVIFMVVNRKELKIAEALIARLGSKVFYSIQDIRTVQEGIFPTRAAQGGLISRLWSGQKVE